MATPVADPLTAVDPQADLGFAAGVTITQSGSRVQNADGSEVWTYTLANYTTPTDAEVIRLQNATALYAAPVIKVAPEKVVTVVTGTTTMSVTSYTGDVPAGTPNTTASFTEDEMVTELTKHLTVMRNTYMVGGGDPEFFERSGSTFDFRISGVDKNTLDQVVLNTIVNYTVQETATAISLTPESISANTLSPPKEAGASLTLPSLPDIDLRLNSGSVTIPVDNPMIGDTRPIMSANVQFPGVCTVEVLPSMTGIIVTPLNEGTVQISVDLEMLVIGPGGMMDVEQVSSSFSTAVNNDGLPVATLNGEATPEVELNGTYTEAGYTNPNPTGDQTINTTGSVDTSVAGDYTLTYAFTNGFGTTTLTRVVTVLPDTTAPVITILGDNPQFVEVGGTYVSPNPPATSDGGEDVFVSGLVSTSTLGDYILTYSATDAAGNVGTATRTVTVRDTVAPVITLNGASTINLTQGDTYTEARASATDNSGEAVSVVIDGTAVDTSAVGTYTVNYSATDSSGNQGTATRSVVVASA
jgi:hypothetical protein